MFPLPDILKSFYQVSSNSFGPPVINGFPLTALISFVLGCSALLTLLCRNIFPGKGGAKLLSRAVPVFFWILFAAYTAFQSAGAFNYWNRNFPALIGKTDTERNQAVFGDIYKFAAAAQEAVPAGCVAAFETGEDILHDPGMVNHRALSYFLYPIDIRQVSGQPESCLVIFKKAGARAFVPDNYAIVLDYGPESLLAVKKRE